MADQEPQGAAGSDDVSIEGPPDLDEGVLVAADQSRAWGSMDLPGMDGADGDE